MLEFMINAYDHLNCSETPGHIIVKLSMIDDLFRVSVITVCDVIIKDKFFNLHFLKWKTQPLWLFKSEQPWCWSQAQIDGVGCDRKGIQCKT